MIFAIPSRRWALTHHWACPIIGKLLGHSQPATTARYSHLDADPMRRAVEIIGGQIAAAMAGKDAEVIQLETSRRKN